jgi:Flp pilus assembly protein TadB
MNKIPQEQLTQKQLERLAAQRQLYSDAKTIQAVLITLSVPCVIVLTLIAAVIPQLRVYVAFWGILVTLLDIIVFTPRQKLLQEKAAKIQQLFDCDVLQMDWSKLNSGSRPEPEAVVEASLKHKRTDPNYSKLQNWYPVSVGQLQIHLARLICQRSNCWWDAQLRRRYAVWGILTVVGLTAIVFLVGLIGGLTLEKFFLVVLAPLIPAFVLGIRHYKEHSEAAIRLDRRRERAEELWNQAIKGRLAPQELTEESYKLQNEIYDNRHRNPLIFDLIYSRLRRQQEEQMNRGAEELVEEALKSP